MKDTEKNELFETAKVTTVIRMFALPAIASSLIGSVYNIVDQIFIGQKIGTLGNAATNVAFPLVMLMVTFSMLIGGEVLLISVWRLAPASIPGQQEQPETVFFVWRFPVSY